MIESLQNISPDSTSSLPNLLSTLDENEFFSQLAQIIAKSFKNDQISLTKAMGVEKAQGVAGHVIRTKKAYYSNSLKRDPLYVPELYNPQMISELCIPIISENMVLGTVHLQSADPQRQFGQKEIDTVLAILAQLKKPLANMQMYLAAKNLNEVLLKKIEEKEIEQKKVVPSFIYSMKTCSDIQMIGKSKAFLEVVKMVEKIGPTNSHILISGETGTGKELLGRKIHNLSLRRAKPYMVVDCASLNTNSNSPSCPMREILQAAKGGTVFLHHISELSLDMQGRLLSLIRENENGHGFHVRILSSTIKDLQKEIEASRFLNELYFHLFSVHIKVPSLSVREDDALRLCEYFLNQKIMKGEGQALTPEAAKVLMAYNWPGNIRELKNIIQSAQILSQGKLLDETVFPEEIRKGAQSREEENSKVLEEAVNITLESLEKKHICQTLDRLLGNKTKAAKALGITVKTLYNKLHAYGMI